jgi:pilus assembly protein Flp/PilA
MKFIKNSKKGQTMVEYSLILALIAVAAIAIMSTMGTSIQGLFSAASTELDAAK